MIRDWDFLPPDAWDRYRSFDFALKEEDFEYFPADVPYYVRNYVRDDVCDEVPDDPPDDLFRDVPYDVHDDVPHGVQFFHHSYLQGLDTYYIPGIFPDGRMFLCPHTSLDNNIFSQFLFPYSSFIKTGYKPRNYRAKVLVFCRYTIF
jgi:hypothetical protein